MEMIEKDEDIEYGKWRQRRIAFRVLIQRLRRIGTEGQSGIGDWPDRWGPRGMLQGNNRCLARPKFTGKGLEASDHSFAFQ